jgi:hypothetical protein
MGGLWTFVGAGVRDDQVVSECVQGLDLGRHKGIVRRVPPVVRDVALLARVLGVIGTVERVIPDAIPTPYSSATSRITPDHASQPAVHSASIAASRQSAIGEAK